MTKYDKHLANRKTVDEILAHRKQALTSFNDAMNNLRRASTALSDAGLGDDIVTSVIRESSMYGCLIDKDLARLQDDMRQATDRKLWDYLGDVTGLLDRMDYQAKEEWRKGLEKNVPECNRETLQATFENLGSQRKLIFNRGLVSCFKSLSKNYKTNDAFKIGPKIIVSHATSHWGDGCDHLTDAERVFYVMDGKKPPVYGSSVRGYLNRVDHSEDFETDYMRVRVFKNGNAHVWLLRDDLVRRANEIIAAFYGGALPG